jgi:hypothetical protein
VYAPQGVQPSRTNGRGLINVLMHDPRPTGSPLFFSPYSAAPPYVLPSSDLPLFRARSAWRRPQGSATSLGVWSWCLRGVEPPVPFPNTVVKRPCANDTAWATAWDNRSSPGPLPLALLFLTYGLRTSMIRGLAKCPGGNEMVASVGLEQSTLTIEEWWGERRSSKRSSEVVI